jgi:hypothetical protein
MSERDAINIVGECAVGMLQVESSFPIACPRGLLDPRSASDARRGAMVDPIVALRYE